MSFPKFFFFDKATFDVFRRKRMIIVASTFL